MDGVRCARSTRKTDSARGSRPWPWLSEGWAQALRPPAWAARRREPWLRPRPRGELWPPLPQDALTKAVGHCYLKPDLQLVGNET